MNIGIDARLLGIENTGIGRYSQNLLDHLLPLDTRHHYTIFLPPRYQHRYHYSHVRPVPVDIPHYSLAEQIRLPILIQSHHLDVMHFLHFNVPLIKTTPFIVTIHDILWHTIRGLNVTTLPPFVYALKYQAYKRVVSHALSQSAAVIVPSRFIKAQLVAAEHVDENKIYPIYEGIDPQFVKRTKKIPKSIEKNVSDSQYIVYTGSAYPHKNLDRLLQAVDRYNQSHPKKVKLVLVSARSVFLDRVQKLITKSGLETEVISAGFLTDIELTHLYAGASALVHVSLSEGFGLTGLEAMAVGLPVLAAAAGSLPEVYNHAALFADPYDPADIAAKLDTILNHQSVKKRLIIAGQKRAATFTWEKTARQTLDLYEQVAKA